MKRILITGAGSYVGTSFENYLAQWPDDYRVDTVDMVDSAWRQMSFSGYDCIFHVAGIAHRDSGELTPERKQLYFRVNTDLTVETAKKAKADGVKQFIFMSSISIYGSAAKIDETRIITRETKPTPIGAYGESKLKAEEGIMALNGDGFIVCVLRPPMIYGPGCKGNYRLLAKTALRMPVFPDIRNERSMLFIDNLCAFVKTAVDSGLSGIFFPQNEEYVCTSDMVRLIALTHGRKIKMVKLFNPLFRFLSGRIGVINKVFGSMVYAKSNSNVLDTVDFPASIERTEKAI